ncbi:efflux RND transporter periplasmic adaptor subunit [Methylobacterium brachythecii]|uniref:Hemolysin secretion protein D n=1 Tax=Methylobacterium brachythecii TaxID=1176177 RepID=A0A7W6F8W0_9HYPH|nr:efflux RND transporter periplasmic adaptor subunit [Methylobacterium brachythecii]MBB3904835.1 RND family efflux transporter MFP subunit [Methylobacterium brachythecii]GLS45387.1 hemolysin secretion protein D [Methylobacterium brachythecii]
MGARSALVLMGFALAACSPAETAVKAEPPLVQTIKVASSTGGVSRYTGVIRARTESNLGFRVSGKIFERLVDPGDRVSRGQPLMRLDRTDFTLALAAARASVEAARAQMIKAKADEERSRKLVGDGWTSKQTYDQNKGAADAAIAQFANAEAQASQVSNQAGYSELQADADGVVMEVPSEPGQVVAAGQTVVKLARDGAREAEVFLPEGSKHLAQGAASATLYAESEGTYPAHLRELSATADPATRTYRARYILAGGGETAPLGATVTLQLKSADTKRTAAVEVPLTALFDRGSGSAVWRYDAQTGTVAGQSVAVARMAEENAEIVSGLHPGDLIVALGAHLLKEGEKVRMAPASMTGVVR